MTCEICKNEILDEAQHCSMCNVTQRKDDTRGKLADERPRISNTFIAIISSLVTIAVVSIWFVLFRMVDFESTGRIRGSSDSYFSINQMNYITSMGGVYLTEDAIYILNSRDEVYIFDHDFNQQATLNIYDGFSSIKIVRVTDEAIYYEIRQSGRDTTTYLYRYDRETRESQKLASGMYHPRIIGDQVFYIDSMMGPSNIYVLDLVDGETSVLFEGEVSEFFVDSVDETIILLENSSLFLIDFAGDIFERLSDSAMFLSFDGESIVWVARVRHDTGARSYLNIFNPNTEERLEFDIDISISRLSLTSDYVILNTLNEMHLLDRENPSSSRLLETSFFGYAFVGDYIIYMDRDLLNINISDIDGNSRVLIER